MTLLTNDINSVSKFARSADLRLATAIERPSGCEFTLADPGTTWLSVTNSELGESTNERQILLRPSRSFVANCQNLKPTISSTVINT